MPNKIDLWFEVLTKMETCFLAPGASTHPFNSDRAFANLLYSTVLSGAAKNAFEAHLAAVLGLPFFPAITGDPKTAVMENVANQLTRRRRAATRQVYRTISKQSNPGVGPMDASAFLALPMTVAFPGNGPTLLLRELMGSDKFFRVEPVAQAGLATSYTVAPQGARVGATIELVHLFK
jgi:hypothetical protein